MQNEFGFCFGKQTFHCPFLSSCFWTFFLFRGTTIPHHLLALSLLYLLFSYCTYTTLSTLATHSFGIIPLSAPFPPFMIYGMVIAPTFYTHYMMHSIIYTNAMISYKDGEPGLSRKIMILFLPSSVLTATACPFYRGEVSSWPSINVWSFVEQKGGESTCHVR